MLSYVAAGNYVGEMALISNAPRSATVRAAVATEAVVLKSARVKRVLAGNESLRAEVDAMAGAKGKKVAVKCDMCKDLPAGPACVRSCPTGAAIRTTPERFLDFAARRESP